MLVFELTVLDFRHDLNAAQQMFVHRIMVIHVELHHRDDLAKIRDEFAQHAGFIHAA